MIAPPACSNQCQHQEIVNVSQVSGDEQNMESACGHGCQRGKQHLPTLLVSSVEQGKVNREAMRHLQIAILNETR
jgi:hypothetical protein